MKNLVFILIALFIFTQNLLALDISLNGQMYRISIRTQGLDYNNLSHRAIMTSNPWWGNSSLAGNAAAQVKASIGYHEIFGNAYGPGFIYSVSDRGYNGNIQWVKNIAFWHPGTNSVKNNWNGVGSASWTAIATPLVDSDGDGIYDLDDLHPGFNDNSLENYLTSEGYATQASYDAIVAERDARPTQASYDAVLAERDYKIEQFSVLASRVNEILPKVVPEAPILSLEIFNELFSEGKQMIEESKLYNDNYNNIDYKIGRVEQQSSNGITENIEEDLEDIINELDFSHLVHSSSYDFTPAKQKFVQAKSFFELSDLETFNELFSEGKQMIEESKLYNDNYNNIDYKIGRVEQQSSNGITENIEEDLEDIINELDFSHLVHSSSYDFTPAKQKFVQAKAEVSNQISIQNAYDPTPVPTATLEEYITSLNSDLTSAREERDNKLSMEEVRDMKLKSRMMQVDGGSASLNITLEATDNLGITSPTWSPVPENKVVIHPNFQNGKIRIDVDGDDNTNSGTKFYRFKMDD